MKLEKRLAFASLFFLMYPSFFNLYVNANVTIACYGVASAVLSTVQSVGL